MMVDGIEKVDPKRFRVTIFGSARIKEDDSSYKQVFALGKLIGSHDIGVITGGGPGVMDAANFGHEAGRTTGESKSIGLNIKLSHEQNANRHLDIRQDFDRFSARLDTFMSLSNVVVVAPAGGIGTILELFYTWQLSQVKHICDIPIILMGEMWEGLIKWMKDVVLARDYITTRDLEKIFLVNTPEEAYEIIEEHYRNFKENGDLACSNYTKYRLKL